MVCLDDSSSGWLTGSHKANHRIGRSVSPRWAT